MRFLKVSKKQRTMNDRNEIWADIPRYKGLYQASNLGRIRRLERPIINHGTHTTKKGDIIKQSLKVNGYKSVTLFYSGKKREELVHRLIAESFIPNPLCLPCINHKDEIKDNNILENLEWCDYRYNNIYGNRLAKAIPKLCHNVIQLSLNGDFIAEYISINEAGRVTKISAGHICHACKGKRHTAGGFIWKYK